MVELGYIALVLALLAAVFALVGFIYGGKEQASWLNRTARKVSIGVFALVTAAVLILEIALLTHNFEIQYVYQYTSTDMSPIYLISVLWAGNTGSLLFWAWVLSICSFILVLRQRPGKRELTPYTLAVVTFGQIFFLLLLIFFANPFARLDPAVFPIVPSEGVGLNPLLENPGMLFHPPTLLAGWAIFTVPFGFAISALINNKLDNTWISQSRRWVVMAWLLLGVGNILGAWWAYAELSWGGYWTWDPIENAGLIPWLLSTALLHSMVVQKRRGGFKFWNIGLATATFATIVLGALLTRSGILQSKHTFLSSAMDVMFVILLIIVIAGSIGLIIWRRNELKTDMTISNLVSREATFLLTNVLLVGSAIVILIGTLSPLLPGLPTVDTTFFNRAVLPIFIALVLLIGLCAAIGWRRPQIRKIQKTYIASGALSLVLIIILIVAGLREWWALAPAFIALFALFSSLITWVEDCLSRKRALSENFFQAALNLIRANRTRYGGYLVHIAIAIMAIGVIGSSVYDTETSAVLAPGETMTANGYEITYESLTGGGDGSRMEIGADLTVSQNGKLIGTMRPIKLFHRSYPGTSSKVAIRYSLVEDLYINLTGWEPIDSEDIQQGYWAGFTVKINPLATWIWIGGFTLLAGGLICYWPKGKKGPASSTEE
jgi:cytochrome c-type biogenesis protein CcmF